jgi:argininosuccinate lyase
VVKSVKSRMSHGGTAPAQVARQARRWAKALGLSRSA